MYGQRKELEAPKMGWEAEILCRHPRLASIQAPGIYEGAHAEQQARDWVEYLVMALIGEEVPMNMLAGYVRHGVVEKVNGRKRLRLTSINKSIRYCTDERDVLRWEDAPAEVASSTATV